MSGSRQPITASDSEQSKQTSSASNEDRSQDSAIILHPTSQRSGVFGRLRTPWLIAGLAFLLTPLTFFWPEAAPIDPTKYAERARRVLKSTPLIDGHNDLPWLLRVELHNRIYDGKIDLEKRVLGHTDIYRMRQGMVGGQFWSVFVDCDVQQKHFEDPSWIIRDTLDQIDITKRFIREHPNHLYYCDSSLCAMQAFKRGRIASMIGIEGSHQIGGGIAALRQFYELGARYITLTHNCDNHFGTAASTVASGGDDTGLFKLGFEAVKEMNRLGMIVDLSHVSHQTMRDVISVARAPVVFSHSGAYSVGKHLRNVPDDVLRSVKKNGGVVMANFVNGFLKPDNPSDATIHDVADHIFYIANICGWECVGIGADYSGTSHVPIGLEDVSKYPDLIEVLMERGATDEQMKMLVGGNILRVWGNIEQRAKEIQASGELPVEDEYDGREWHETYVGEPSMLRESQLKAIAKAAKQ